MVMNEFMVADAGVEDVVYSEFSLAYLEDTNWYQADYSYATPMVWGKGKGCGFITNA
jgi:leishmanolysin-like peptidase